MNKKYGLMDITKDILKMQVAWSPAEDAERRIAICNTCPDLSKLRACNHCGCFMDAKVKFEKSTCPIGKW